MTSCPPEAPVGEIFPLTMGAPLRPGATPEVVGFKAYNLMRMAAAGLPTPPAVVLGTGLCREYRARERAPDRLSDLLAAAVHWLEKETGRGFGDGRRPLLVSVRSGAPVSMPGMMETVLNVGMNEATVSGLIRATGNPRLAWDSYRRFVVSYAEVVLGCPEEPFRRAVRQRLDAAGLLTEEEFGAADLRALTQEFCALAKALGGAAPPQEPAAQLRSAVEAVMRSWMSAKACAYRRLAGISDELGTATLIQTMAFGNAGLCSGSGVGFTRDPATGANELYVDFLFNAQGEDVVSGRAQADDAQRLPELLPQVWAEIRRARETLERLFCDMQDFEFTVEEGRLWLLQSRDGKRTPWAALQIAVEMAEAGLIEPAEALRRTAAIDLEALEWTRLDAGGQAPIACGVAAGLGVASGPLAFDSARALALAEAGRAPILARPDIATADVEGVSCAAGVLSARGARTAHAAVVARELGKPCIVGLEALRVDSEGRQCWLGGRRLGEGDEVTIDGASGQVFVGRVPAVRTRPTEALAALERLRSRPRREAGPPPRAFHGLTEAYPALTK